jgi:hypothetical protein
VIAYRAMLDVPGELLIYVARLLRARRRELGTRKGTRVLTCYKQAVFALVWFRDKPCIPRLGKGFGLSQATSYRYLNEVIDVLAAQAPDLRQALERAGAVGLPHLILDGKVVETDRCREKTTSVRGDEIDLWYCGKVRSHAGNVQAVLAPGGFPLWVSAVGLRRRAGLVPRHHCRPPACPAGPVLGRVSRVRADNLVHGSDQQSCSLAVRP